MKKVPTEIYLTQINSWLSSMCFFPEYLDIQPEVQKISTQSILNHDYKSYNLVKLAKVKLNFYFIFMVPSLLCDHWYYAYLRDSSAETSSGFLYSCLQHIVK